MEISGLVFFILLSTSGFSQSYQFDQLVSYDVKNNESRSFQKLINSQDDSYEICFLPDNLFEIFDRNTHIKHVYKMHNLKGNGEFKFSYMRSCDESAIFEEMNRRYRNRNSISRFEQISEDEFVIKYYKRAKAKKPERTVYVRVEESEIDQLDFLHKLDSDIKRELKKVLDSTKNYSVKEILLQGKLKNESKRLELTSVQPNEFQITLPKELNYECVYPIMRITTTNIGF